MKPLPFYERNGTVHLYTDSEGDVRLVSFKKCKTTYNYYKEVKNEFIGYSIDFSKTVSYKVNQGVAYLVTNGIENIYIDTASIMRFLQYTNLVNCKLATFQFLSNKYESGFYKTIIAPIDCTEIMEGNLEAYIYQKRIKRLDKYIKSGKSILEYMRTKLDICHDRDVPKDFNWVNIYSLLTTPDINFIVRKIDHWYDYNVKKADLAKLYDISLDNCLEYFEKN